MARMAKLTVCEIFLSIQGEGRSSGLPCAFVRLAGCNLRCSWCDTAYAWTGGEAMSIAQVLARLEPFRCRRVEVTGGEPLAQEATLELLQRLCDGGYQVLLETNGSLDIAPVDRRVVRIVDFKCPSSGQESKNLWANVAALTDSDEVKFVVADRTDYDYACAKLIEHQLCGRCTGTFSPVFGRLDPGELAGWILADGLDVRLGLQLHKILWPGRSRGV
jgi:7-carboxy-7-deazaguanine synthase